MLAVVAPAAATAAAVVTVATDADSADVDVVVVAVVVLSSYTCCCYVRSWGESMENSSLYRAGNTTLGCCCLNLLSDSICIMEMSLQ